MIKRILLYGATGYMGRLLAQRAKELELPVVLAGRTQRKVAEVAEQLDLPHLAFALEPPAARDERLKRRAPLPTTGQRPSAAGGPNQAVDKALSNVGVVLNAAGPFAETALPLARACLRTGTHYVDIGGEHDVFGALRTLYDEASQTGVAIVPGAGLTALASDLLLREALKEGQKYGMGAPHVVRVALSRVPAISRGSAKTMLESVRNGVRVTQNGRVVAVPVGALVRSFNFGSEDASARAEPRICTAMTLADSRFVNATVNAVLNPGRRASSNLLVPNIETYVEASSLEQLSYELGGELALALRTFPLKNSLEYALSLWPEGPAAGERDSSSQQVVVELEDRYRRIIEARLSTPNSYDFTVAAGLSAASRLTTANHGLEGLLSPGQVVTIAHLEDFLPPRLKSAAARRERRPQLDARGFARKSGSRPDASAT